MSWRHHGQMMAAAKGANQGAAAADIDGHLEAVVERAPAQSDAELAAAALGAAQADADAAKRQRLLVSAQALLCLYICNIIGRQPSSGEWAVVWPISLLFRMRQVKAKERVALLRSAQAAKSRPASQAQGAQQSSPATERSSSSSGDGSSGGGNSSSSSGRNPVLPTAQAAAPDPDAQPAAAAPPPIEPGSSRGIVAAQAARQKQAVSAASAWAPVQSSAPPFPPKNPKTRRRVERGTATVDAQVFASRAFLTSMMQWSMTGACLSHDLPALQSQAT